LPVNVAYAGTINVAVASNALIALKFLADDFFTKYNHKVVISSGSTGKLYSQIINGAPFDIFLAANEREPLRLEQNNAIVTSSRFTYAYGRLALCTIKQKFNNDIKNIVDFNKVQFNRLAIANPKIAPYGLAAEQFLKKKNIWEVLQNKIIRAENINQAFQYVISGNADFGVVALSQVKQYFVKPLYCKVISDTLHEALKQQAVLLTRSKNNPAANEFYTYLKSKQVKFILNNKFGYSVN